MALYKKAGVNPMGGCLPMLFQFPFLIAMFFFFPTSIELRQQGFLWAHDLSTYDSILHLPFNIPMYGDHVSLFCLLMTVTTIISTHLNSQTTASQGHARNENHDVYHAGILPFFTEQLFSRVKLLLFPGKPDHHRTNIPYSSFYR